MAIATDDFNRAALGSDWTNAYGTLAINSNRVTGATSSAECVGFFNVHTYSASQYAQCSVTIGNDWAGVAVRASANNSYQFYVISNQWEILKVVAGATTLIASGSRTFANNDVLRLEAEGTTLRGYHNGVLIASVNDSSLTSGSPGLSFYSNDATYNSFMDNWEGGDLHNEIIGRDTFYIRNHPAYRR